MCAKEYNSKLNVVVIYGIIRQLPNRMNYVIMLSDGNKLPYSVQNMAPCLGLSSGTRVLGYPTVLKNPGIET
jgi:hypothetical protein